MRSDKPKGYKYKALPPPEAMDITDDKFKELTDLAVRMVEEQELGKNKSMLTTLIVHFREFVDGDNQVTLSDIQSSIVIIAGTFNNETKQPTVQAIGKEFFEKKWFPVAVFMVSESWVSEVSAEEIDLPDRPMPSQDPNRKECIIIAGRTPATDDCKVGVMVPIIHDDDGNMIRAGENTVTNELDTHLLDQFFVGFFEPITSKFTKQQMEDMIEEYEKQQRGL